MSKHDYFNNMITLFLRYVSFMVEHFSVIFHFIYMESGWEMISETPSTKKIYNQQQKKHDKKEELQMRWVAKWLADGEKQ